MPVHFKVNQQKMKRQSFLKLLFATGSLLMGSFNSFAKKVTSQRHAKGFKVDAGSDRNGKPISLLEGICFILRFLQKIPRATYISLSRHGRRKAAQPCTIIIARMNGGISPKVNSCLRWVNSLLQQKPAIRYSARGVYLMHLPRTMKATPEC